VHRAELPERIELCRGRRIDLHRCSNCRRSPVLNALPKSQQGKAKADLQAIWMAATRADAHAVFDRFVTIYAAKYPKATETLKKDRESLLALYDFPADNWQHLRTTDRVDVRHRAPAYYAHAQLRVATNLPGSGIQADRVSRENMAAHQRPRTDHAVA
jgi:hypothetical protein